MHKMTALVKTNVNRVRGMVPDTRSLTRKLTWMEALVLISFFVWYAAEHVPTTWSGKVAGVLTPLAGHHVPAVMIGFGVLYWALYTLERCHVNVRRTARTLLASAAAYICFKQVRSMAFLNAGRALMRANVNGFARALMECHGTMMKMFMSNPDLVMVCAVLGLVVLGQLRHVSTREAWGAQLCGLVGLQPALVFPCFTWILDEESGRSLKRYMNHSVQHVRMATALLVLSVSSYVFANTHHVQLVKDTFAEKSLMLVALEMLPLAFGYLIDESEWAPLSFASFCVLLHMHVPTALALCVYSISAKLNALHQMRMAYGLAMGMFVAVHYVPIYVPCLWKN